MHDVYHENRDVAEAGAAGTQVGERLVPRRVYDEKSGHLELDETGRVVSLGCWKAIEGRD